MALARQLLRHLEGDDRAERLSAKEVRALRLSDQDRFVVDRGQRLDGSQDLTSLSEVGTLKSEKWSVGREQSRQHSEMHHLAANAVHAEEGCLEALGLKRHQDGAWRLLAGPSDAT